MAAGDLVVDDYQVELRATLMGDTTDFAIRYFDPLEALVDVEVKMAETAYAHADGSFVGDSHDAARSLGLPLIITGSTVAATGTNVETLRTTWAAASAELPLYFQIPGFGKKFVNGWPLGIRFDLTDLALKRALGFARFRITDPTIRT